MIVAIDFDNCLVEYADSPFGAFTLKPKAREVLEKYNALGVRFVLNTSRYGKHLRAALRFIKKEGLPIQYRLTFSKICADVYIDDRNIFCKEINWLEIDKELRRVLNETKK